MSTRSTGRNALSWASVARTLSAFARAWQRRRLVGRLGALDDHLLADMGITRYDVMSVLAEPLLVDPSEKLAERALESRRARRSLIRDVHAEDARGDASRRAA